MENNDNNVQNQVNQNVKEMHQPKEKKSNGNKAKGFVVFVFLVLFLGAGFGLGYLFAGKWDPFKENNNTTTNNTATNNAVETKSAKKIDESKPWVYDAEYLKGKEEKKVDYDISNEKYSTKECIIAPYINVDSEEAKKANQEIEEITTKQYTTFGKKDGESIYYVTKIDYLYSNNDNAIFVLVLYNTSITGTGSEIDSIKTYNIKIKNQNNDDSNVIGGYSKEAINSKIEEFSKNGNQDGDKLKMVDNEYFVYNNKLYIVCTGGYTSGGVRSSNNYVLFDVDNMQEIPYYQIKEVLTGKEESQNKNAETLQSQTTAESKQDFSVFSQYKGKKYRNEDFNTTPEAFKEYCILTFDENGKPTIKMGYKSDNNTECYFQTKETSNLKSDGAAGTTYVTFDFTAWTAGGDTTGNATISFSNVTENDYSMTVSAKVNYNTGSKEYNNIKVKPVGQTASENATIDVLKNRVYESEKKENSFWYKVEFDEKGNPTITEGYLAGGVSQIVDTYRRFTDVSSEGAAGSVYVTFSYRLLNETGDKVEGRLKYSNNTDNKEIYLKMYNKDNNENEVMLKQVK